jgi:hypothetical protein
MTISLPKQSLSSRTIPNTIIAELANGLLGYIPSRRAYTQRKYEVVSARCAEGSGERLLDAAVKILQELHTETAEIPRRW